jgi:hypothetical protein
MDDSNNVRRAPSSQVLAAVVRQFAGSRIEQQLLAQVFDLVWQGGASREALRDYDENVSHDGDGCAATVMGSEGGSL